MNYKKMQNNLPPWLAEFLKSLAFAFVLVTIIRTFLFEPFHIPSGSMIPSLLIGDYLFVNKYIYGYGEYSFPLDIPLITKGRWLTQDTIKRGDVIVFRSPNDTSINFIKRVVAIGGDSIRVIDGRLEVNGDILERDLIAQNNNGDQALYVETNLDGRRYFILEERDDDIFDNTPLYQVPDSMYFVMGDNRDSSRDSRDGMVRFIPYENVVGRAEMIFLSLEPSRTMFDFLFFPLRLRITRFGEMLS